MQLSENEIPFIVTSFILFYISLIYTIMHTHLVNRLHCRDGKSILATSIGHWLWGKGPGDRKLNLHIEVMYLVRTGYTYMATYMETCR